MKAIIIMGGLAFGVIYGLLHKLDTPKPAYWKIGALLLVAALSFLNFLPPLGADFNYAQALSQNLGKKNTPVYAKILTNPEARPDGLYQLKAESAESKVEESHIVALNEKDAAKLSAGDKAVIRVEYQNETQAFNASGITSVNPIITIPYIVDLDERVRILNFHVPMAWVAVLAYLVSMVFSVRYLRGRSIIDDQRAAAAASLGTLFAILATVTGMVWAKFNWGAFWSWDPREVSIFFLLLIYGAYFTLRSVIENEETRAKFSSVYSIIAFITVPFFIFILPRLTESLHPGSASDDNAGPALSAQPDTLDPVMQVLFSLGLAAFTVLFFWMFNLTARYKKMDRAAKKALLTN